MAAEVVNADKVLVMSVTLLPVHRIIAVALLTGLPLAAWAAIGTAQAPSDSAHYRSCLSAANLNPAAALSDAADLGEIRRRRPAQHCAARGAGEPQALCRSGHAAGPYRGRPRRAGHVVPRGAVRPGRQCLAAGGRWRHARCRVSRRRWRCRPATPICSPIWPAPRPCAMTGMRWISTSMRRCSWRRAAPIFWCCGPARAAPWNIMPKRAPISSRR